MGMLLSEIFDIKSIINLESRTKETAFNDLVSAISEIHPECDQTLMLESLWKREAKLSTGITAGVAVPHAICKGINRMAGAIGISKTGIEYNALNKEPVYIIFMLVMDEKFTEKHLTILNQIIKLINSKELEHLKYAKNAQDIHEILCGF